MAKVFLGLNDRITLSNSNTIVKGFPNGNEKVLINAGVSGITTDANIESIDLSGLLSSYQFKVTAGSGIQIFDTSNQLITTVQSINADAMKIAFTDGTADLVQTGGTSFSLGGQTISTVSMTNITATTLGTAFNTSIKSAIATSSGSTSVTLSSATPTITDAGVSANTTYTVSKGTYTTTITGFGAGDKLVLFSGASVTVMPDSILNDGKESIQIVDASNNVVTIVLAGLSQSQEYDIFNQSSINTVFGAGTIA